MTTYAQKLGNFVHSTFVGVALSLSKEVGILQALLDADQPLTSNEIANKKGLKERYVRELLGSLATAEIIHVSTNEAGCLVYHLEEGEKQVFKTPLMAFIALSGAVTTVYETVKGCIPKTGPHGTRYSDAVHDVIDELSVYCLDANVDSMMTFVDGLKEKLESGIEVIEFGCGRGRLLARLAQMFPKSTFVASDQAPFLLEHLKANLGHIPNIKYEINDLCSLSDAPVKQYDWIYCVDVIHDLPNPEEALKGIRKLVKEPNGIFSMIDIATSGTPIADRGKLDVASFYTLSTFMCIPESFQREDSQALGACWGKQTAINLATSVGFKVKAEDIYNNFAIYICKP